MRECESSLWAFFDQTGDQCIIILYTTVTSDLIIYSTEYKGIFNKYYLLQGNRKANILA